MIDVNKIPKTELTLLAKSAIPKIIEFYEDPGNERKFQEWLKKKINC